MLAVARTAARAALGLVLGLSGAEAMLRLGEVEPLWRVALLPEPALYTLDDAVGYAHRPGSFGIWTRENRARVSINAVGLRDRERAEGPPRARRVGVFGNSMVEAFQVEQHETFTALAEAALQVPAPGAEVWNFGISGATPAVQAARLHDRGPKHQLTDAFFFTWIADFIDPALRNDSAFVAYRPGADGTWGPSRGFLNGRGYKARKTAPGQLFYLALDHSRLAVAANARKNVGLFKEVPIMQPAPTPPADDREGVWCRPILTAKLKALWVDRQPADQHHAALAFLDQLAEPWAPGAPKPTLALYGLGDACPEAAADRAATWAALEVEAQRRGLSLVDFDATMTARLPAGERLSDLVGFGEGRGAGHLNHLGHERIAAWLADRYAP